MCSPIKVPAILVLIGLNSPRTFDGASGLGSQISMCDGPPCRKIITTLLADSQPRAPAYLLATVAALACSRQKKKCGRLRPIRPMEPMRNTSRRVGPSQLQPRCPGRFSMISTLYLKLIDVQKGFAVDQRPQEILGATSFGCIRQILHSALTFLLGREATQRRKIKLVHDGFVALAAQNQLGHAPIGI